MNIDSEDNLNLLHERKDILLNSNSTKCCYCPKIFLDSKFLLKHLLRRHSENIISLHKQLLDGNKCHSTGTSSNQDLINIISNEFSKLKQELKEIKNLIRIKNNDITYFLQESIKEKEALALEIFSEKEKEKEGKEKLRNLEIVFSRIEKLMTDFITEWRNHRVSPISGREIFDCTNCTGMRNNLLHELKSIITNILEENNSLLKHHIADFKTAVDMLNNLLSLNIQTRTSNSPERTEEKLINDVQYSLKDGSKVNLAEKTPCSNDFDISDSIKEIPLHDNNVTITEEKNSSKLNLEFETNEMDIQSLVYEKLKNLNLKRPMERLPLEDFNKKINLIELERKNLGKSFKCFSKFRHDLDSEANKKTCFMLKDWKNKKPQ